MLETQPRVLDVRAALQQGMSRLRERGVPSHTLAAELLLMHVLHQDRAWLYAHPEAVLDDAAATHYFELIHRRASGTPTQYLTGEQEFWGQRFHVGPGVLIPRPETEHVVEVALERLRSAAGEVNRRGDGLRIVDVGTGSGCIAVALARELPGAYVFATDISNTALTVARSNASRHKAQVHFVQCSLLEAFLPWHTSPDEGSRFFDLIVSNPPYVARLEEGALLREVREHEPAQALFGGAQGQEIYTPLIQQAGLVLAAGGVLVLELAYNALAHVRPLLDPSLGWTQVTVTNDLAGIPRVIAAQKI